MGLRLMLIWLGLLLASGWGHPVKEVTSGAKEVVAAVVNQPRSILVPFRKCFRVEPEFEADRQYL